MRKFMDIPSFTIIIPVRDRPQELRNCLYGIAQQEYLGHIDVIVVDDGSQEPINQQTFDVTFTFPVRFVRQGPSGISAARNYGIHLSQGDYLLFVDSDCEMLKGCLSNLIAYIKSHREALALQLRIIGHNKTLSGKMFHLRIVATFSQLSEGETIRIANTSGFAIHRSLVDQFEFFDPRMKRGEDTELLARLIQQNIWPQYVESALVRHAFYASTGKYILKHFRWGYDTVPARKVLSKTAPVLMNQSQKFGLIKTMFQTAKSEKISFGVIVLIFLAGFCTLVGRESYRIWYACKNGKMSRNSEQRIKKRNTRRACKKTLTD